MSGGAGALNIEKELRKAVLNQVREIRELNEALEAERKKNESLEKRVKELEARLEELESQGSSSKTAMPAPLPSSPSSALLKRGLLSKKGTSPGTSSLRSASQSNARKVSSSAELFSPRFTNNAVAYPEAIRILRLLERPDVANLGRTCRTWRSHCSSYLAEWRRTRLALELCDTERTFVKNVQNTVERYVVTRTVGTKVMDDEEAFILFANLEDILSCQRKLYTHMHQSLLKWHPRESVANFFLHCTDFCSEAANLFFVYSSNQTDALSFAQQLRFEMRIPDGEWRALESLLIQPIQRVPRYVLLVRELQANMWKCDGASDELEDEAEEERVRLRESMTLLDQIGRAMERGMEQHSRVGQARMLLAHACLDLPVAFKQVEWLERVKPLHFTWEVKRCKSLVHVARATDALVMLVTAPLDFDAPLGDPVLLVLDAVKKDTKAGKGGTNASMSSSSPSIASASMSGSVPSISGPGVGNNNGVGGAGGAGAGAGGASDPSWKFFAAIPLASVNINGGIVNETVMVISAAPLHCPDDVTLVFSNSNRAKEWLQLLQ